MNERIYYTDPTCREFQATVTSNFEHGGKPAVVLDRTAFYPTSGGQPFDTGTLGDRKVVDVLDEDGRVVHVLDGDLVAGQRVSGVIDWVRRADHMQQHTGQHILSAAFDGLSGNPTVSFHLGADTCSIDLAKDASPADVDAAEREANRIVWADEAVTIRFVTEDEARRLSLRKESQRVGTLRLIDIPGFDLSACGGTHVSRTGQVGMVAVLGVEKFKGGSRVSFVCGERALRSHRALRTAVTESVRVLSVLPADLPGAIAKLQAESKDQSKTIKTLRESLAVYEAQALLEGATLIGGVRLVVRAMPGADAGSLKTMAVAMSSAGGVAVALFTEASPAQVVIARSSDVRLDAAATLKALVAQYGGKGGGKPDLAQGGGLAGDVRQIVWTASGLIEEELGR